MLTRALLIGASAILLPLSGCANKEIVEACEDAEAHADECALISGESGCSGSFFKSGFSAGDADQISCMYQCFESSSCAELAEYFCAPHAAYRNTDTWSCFDACRIQGENVYVVGLDIDCSSVAANSDFWPLGVTEERVASYCDNICASVQAGAAKCGGESDLEECEAGCKADSTIPICLAEREALLLCTDNDEIAGCVDGRRSPSPISCVEEFNARDACLCGTGDWSKCD